MCINGETSPYAAPSTIIKADGYTLGKIRQGGLVENSIRKFIGDLVG